MDIIFDSSDSNNEDIQRRLRSVNQRINFDIDNFEECFRVSMEISEQILKQIAPNITHSSNITSSNLRIIFILFIFNFDTY